MFQFDVAIPAVWYGRSQGVKGCLPRGAGVGMRRLQGLTRGPIIDSGCFIRSSTTFVYEYGVVGVS